jgi:hemoglobin
VTTEGPSASQGSEGPSASDKQGLGLHGPGASPGASSMYDRVGGRDWFVALVDRFYDRVADDDVLRPLYPEDLGPPREHLSLFLIQYWGGPGDYSAQRGHPRLRMRHQPFAIGNAERLAWYRAMVASVREGGLSDEDEEEMISYFASTATSLMNTGRAGVGTPVTLN